MQVIKIRQMQCAITNSLCKEEQKCLVLHNPNKNEAEGEQKNFPNKNVLDRDAFGICFGASIRKCLNNTT